MSSVIHICHCFDTQECWVLFESTGVKPLGPGASPGLKVLKMRDFGWVLLCGQRVNKVSARAVWPVCLSVPLGSPGTKQGHPARGADGAGGEYWKAAAPALWCGLLLPVGRALYLRPNTTDCSIIQAPGKGMPLERGVFWVQRHQPLQCCTSRGSQAPHCNEQ